MYHGDSRFIPGRCFEPCPTLIPAGVEKSLHLAGKRPSISAASAYSSYPSRRHCQSDDMRETTGGQRLFFQYFINRLKNPGAGFLKGSFQGGAGGSAMTAAAEPLGQASDIHTGTRPETNFHAAARLFQEQ